MAPIVEALRGGANVVVTGRVTDTGLTLGPIFHEFGWSPEDWDKVAAGTVAGHIIECGAQASGGNLLRGWRAVKGLANPGFPIVEASPDGTFVVTKHPNTGGVVSVPSVTEQLVYEMGDPTSYITPDGVADFTTIRLRQAGRDRVRGERHPGRRRAPPMLKVSIAYFYGYKAVGTLVYSWPEAYDKARAADRIAAPAARGSRPRVRADPHRVRRGRRDPRQAQRASPTPTCPRCSFASASGRAEKAPVERFTREIAPLVLTGPPSVTGFAGGRPAVEEVVAYWPALIDRREIEPTCGYGGDRCLRRGRSKEVEEVEEGRQRTPLRRHALAPAPLPRSRPLGRQGQHRQRRPHRARARVLSDSADARSRRPAWPGTSTAW